MKKIIILGLIILLVVGCSSKRQVTRLDPESTTDLSGKWNDTDSRLVAEEMITDALNRPWLINFVEQNGERPVVTVGRIRNNSSEHIDIETFTTDFERELLNSGKVRFVANKFQREDVRDERLDQDEWASAETRKRLREELGADFILLGAIKSITDQIEGKMTISYQTDLELVNIETNEKVWIGNKVIKKGISQGKTKW
ncbi:MAG: penicillin-binding protein activator LpoB [candidate division Zixibacteria bacterium]|nr:penicillin-binding protein activator LpoB [candidate division Zixibacteria bacterium]NIT53036.1 penicillin-binding protein activator LpoB [candidate division Zixibacteria bacterium]NIW41274.1 penicillin-binding protein activator LpoB [candidate division Zixibacteria bacterium]NIX58050.1 penicillin-binding protein activator LpoB [candidate division Zixibacteria bacterium]